MEHVTIIQIILTPLRKDDKKKFILFYFILVFLIFKFLIFILKIFALYKVQIETELAFNK
jgi:hypothetical protein